MSKLSYVLLICAIALGLAACSANPTKDTSEAKAKVANCVFPNTLESAPLWICDEAVEGMEFSAVGYAEKSSAGKDFMKQIAATNARVQLTSRMKVQVQNKIRKYAEISGAAGGVTQDKLSFAARLLMNQVLFEARIYKSVLSTDGALYVLVGVDVATAQKLTQSFDKLFHN